MTSIAATANTSIAQDSTRAAASPATKSGSRRRFIVSHVVSGVAVLFLAFDGCFKLFAPPEMFEGSSHLGWPGSTMVALGALQVALLAMYLVPRLAPLGAILWTGYLGGAIAVHVRVFDPLFTHTIFPVYVAAFLWGGLFLRDARVRALLGPRG